MKSIFAGESINQDKSETDLSLVEAASICMICLMHNSLANQLAAQSIPFAVTPITPRFTGASQNFAKKARMGNVVSKNFAPVCVHVETASQSVVTEYISPSVSQFIIFPACCCVVLVNSRYPHKHSVEKAI